MCTCTEKQNCNMCYELSRNFVLLLITIFFNWIKFFCCIHEDVAFNFILNWIKKFKKISFIFCCWLSLCKTSHRWAACRVSHLFQIKYATHTKLCYIMSCTKFLRQQRELIDRQTGVKADIQLSKILVNHHVCALENNLVVNWNGAPQMKICNIINKHTRIHWRVVIVRTSCDTLISVNCGKIPRIFYHSTTVHWPPGKVLSLVAKLNFKTSQLCI